MPSAPVPEGAKQACETRDPRQWTWVEPSVWTERMLAALVNGVKGGKWYSLWDKVCDRRTLAASWEGVARNQGAAGVDGVSIKRFAAHAEKRSGEKQGNRPNHQNRDKSAITVQCSRHCVAWVWRSSPTVTTGGL